MSTSEIAARAWGWPRLIVASLVGGVAFNITQRALDWALDHIFATVGWLQWLNN